MAVAFGTAELGTPSMRIRMRQRFGVLAVLGSMAVITMGIVSGAVATAQTPLALDSARVTISGTSNIHPYSASTTTIRVTRMAIAAGAHILANALTPGAIEAFEISIP